MIGLAVAVPYNCLDWKNRYEVAKKAREVRVESLICNIGLNAFCLTSSDFEGLLSGRR